MEKQIDILIKAMTAQLANPARAVVNSESAFVKDRLNKLGEYEIANKYWNWLCCTRWQTNPIFGEEVQALQLKLEAIDKQSTMPSWGTYGT